MVKQIRIYIEGGGDRSDTKAEVRRGFSEFLEPLCKIARERKIQWHLVVCGSREAAFDRFKSGLKDHPESCCILLVDSEAPVTQGPWKHLEGRDGWKISTADEQCHLMVHCMESWLIADPTALAEFYGQGFRLNALPRTLDVETVTKERSLPPWSKRRRRRRRGGITRSATVQTSWDGWTLPWSGNARSIATVSSWSWRA